MYLWSHQSPEHWKNSRGPQYEEATQSLRIVGFHHLDNPQQSLDARSPQVAHVKTLQIHQTSPTAEPHVNT